MNIAQAHAALRQMGVKVKPPKPCEIVQVEREYVKPSGPYYPGRSKADEARDLAKLQAQQEADYQAGNVVRCSGMKTIHSRWKDDYGNAYLQLWNGEVIKASFD